MTRPGSPQSRESLPACRRAWVGRHRQPLPHPHHQPELQVPTRTRTPSSGSNRSWPTTTSRSGPRQTSRPSQPPGDGYRWELRAQPLIKPVCPLQSKPSALSRTTMARPRWRSAAAKQVWPLTQFFSVSFREKSLICLESKSMAFCQGNTILFRSSQQLPRLGLLNL